MRAFADARIDRPVPRRDRIAATCEQRAYRDPGDDVHQAAREKQTRLLDLLQSVPSRLISWRLGGVRARRFTVAVGFHGVKN
jgi:hypothetical protein